MVPCVDLDLGHEEVAWVLGQAHHAFSFPSSEGGEMVVELWAE